MLQHVARSFGELHRGHLNPPKREREIQRFVGQLGTTAVPVCVRELRSADEDRARWAYALLGHIAAIASTETAAGSSEDSARGECSERVIRAMRELAQRPDVEDASKLRALALLSELDAAMPDTQFHDLQEVHNRSVRQLAACLTSPAEVAQAADMLIGQLEDDELANFVDQLATSEPDRGELLIDEMLVRDDLEGGIHRELRRIRAELAIERTEPSPQKHKNGDSRRKTHVCIGRREDGRTVIVASQRKANTRPVRWRALCCSMSQSGALMDALYEEEYTPGLLKKTVTQPLQAEGFEFDDIELDAAAALLASAAQATLDAGEHLPRGFYLGRDLVHLYNEHLHDEQLLASERIDDELASLLARSMDLMQREAHERARPLLERYLAQVPDDPAARAALGVCFLVANELREADAQLQRAAWLEPGNPLHYWNLASVAHRQGRLGGCYQCFSAYVDRHDNGSDSPSRHRLASEFIGEYERLARLEFPDVPPGILARAEEQLFDARWLAKNNQLEQAVVELRKGVRLMPSHHPSWCYLATLYNEREQLAQAKRCASRAVTLAPNDSDSHDLLTQITYKLSKRKRLKKRSAPQAPGTASAAPAISAAVPATTKTRK